MNPDDLKDRIKDFAHRCVKLALALPKTTLGNHIKGQLIRCSTSAAANYRAVCIAQSKPDFISKLSIVIEETDESSFSIVARRPGINLDSCIFEENRPRT